MIDAPAAALGCMRLPSDQDQATAVIHAALDAGARLLDTADVYGPGDETAHHNEVLVSHALASWVGDRAAVVIATKGGLGRTGGAWRPDGRARQLIAAAEASCAALGVPRLDLWQWHAPDPRVGAATSLRAVAAIARRGLAAEVGVCNLNVGELALACDVAPVVSLQVALGPQVEGAVRSGVVAEALRRGLLVLAHTPLGGARGAARLSRHPALIEVGERVGATPIEVALAWLGGLHPRLVALPGATRVTTARSAARAAVLILGPADLEILDAAFPLVASLREGGALTQPPPERATAAEAPAPRDVEVVMLVGGPGAGKSTHARELEAAGWQVLSRDATGGRLDAMATRLEAALGEGVTRVVLDATYTTRAARHAVLRVAARRGVPLRCVWIDTPIDDAQINVCLRLLARHGRLPSPAALRALARSDPHALAPSALFKHRRELEPPVEEEGFAAVERRVFARASPGADQAPAPRAVLIDLDSSLWSSRRGARAPIDPADVVLDAAAAAALRRLAREGAAIWATTWQPELGEAPAAAEALRALAERVIAELEAPIEIRACTHPPGPPICWCRRPLPGLALELLHQAGLAPHQVLSIGRTTLDASLARRLGMRHRHLAPPSTPRPDRGRC